MKNYFSKFGATVLFASTCHDDEVRRKIRKLRFKYVTLPTNTVTPIIIT